MLNLKITPPHSLSSRVSLSPLSLPSTSSLPFHVTIPMPLITIRNGGGPRTFPGGVSKWQWKRMQAKKSKQLLKARLARERQVYDMRKRAELKAAVVELERPWESVRENAPRLFSVSADEQVKVLADRFQRPGGFDMWSERDGPQLFSSVDGIPSTRFFPKGVVHSTMPYGKIGENSNGAPKLSLPTSLSEGEDDLKKNVYNNSDRFGDSFNGVQSKAKNSTASSKNRNGKNSGNGKLRKNDRESGENSVGAVRLSLSPSVSKEDVERNGYKNSGRIRSDFSSDGQIKANKSTKKNSVKENGKIGSKTRFRIGKSMNFTESRGSSTQVYDMNLRDDGSYGFEADLL